MIKTTISKPLSPSWVTYWWKLPFHFSSDYDEFTNNNKNNLLFLWVPSILREDYYPMRIVTLHHNYGCWSTHPPTPPPPPSKQGVAYNEDMFEKDKKHAIQTNLYKNKFFTAKYHFFSEIWKLSPILSCPDVHFLIHLLKITPSMDSMWENISNCSLARYLYLLANDY